MQQRAGSSSPCPHGAHAPETGQTQKQMAVHMLSLWSEGVPRPRECGEEQRTMTNSAHGMRDQAPWTLTISEVLQIIQVELHTPEQLA